MPRYKSWDEIRRQADLDENHIAAYGRLCDAEERLYEARRRRGFTDAMMARALGVDESDASGVGPEGDDDMFLFELGRHAAAAGGWLELRAVFDDEEVLLLREPADS